MSRPNTPAASILFRESVRRATLADSLSDILNTVWQCERFEREHPTTCATIRSLAPRKVRQSHEANPQHPPISRQARA